MLEHTSKLLGMTGRVPIMKRSKHKNKPEKSVGKLVRTVSTVSVRAKNVYQQDLFNVMFDTDT